jgi:hypothetical protein
MRVKFIVLVIATALVALSSPLFAHTAESPNPEVLQ